MTLAITRDVSARFNECEITHIDRTPINVDVARRQHHAYNEALKELGCAVLQLPAQNDLPDSVFVEDTAIVLPEVAVITNPGADSRKPEIATIAEALKPYRSLVHITHPATVDGGDVLVLGKQIFIGLSTRSNQEAINQMQVLLKPYGYTITGVEIHDCLHLKTAVTKVDDSTLLINRKWVDMEHFEGFNLIDVDASEPFAANCLPVNGQVIYPEAFPRTRAVLEQRGYKIKPVKLDELAKAEGAVTCCSLIVG